MIDLALFAETPRAEGLGHRFLVPDNLSVSETEIASFFRAAEGDVSVGENFVAISRRVPQCVGEGTVRLGREVVVLAGVDVSQVSGHAFARMLKSLQGCLDNLERLVLYEIDWKGTVQAEVIVRRTEVVEWLNGLRAASLPLTEWRDGPRPLLVAGPTLPSQTPVSPICKVTRRKRVVVLLMSFAVGIAVGAVGRQLFLDDSTTTPISKTSASGGPGSKIEKRKEILEPKPISDVKKPTSVAAPVSVDVVEPLRKAIDSGEVDAVRRFLSSLPSDAKISTQDGNAIINFCGRLLRLKRFDDGAQVAQLITSRRSAFSLEPEQIAQMKDLQTKAEEGCRSIDQQDQKLYELIRELNGMEQVKAARTYLKDGPRKTMAKPVRCWLDYVERTITAEVIKTTGRANIPFKITFRTSGRDKMQREKEFEVKSVDVISKSRPLTLAIITGRDLPASISVTLELLDEAQPARFIGELQVGQQSGGEIEVKLRSPVPILNPETFTLTVRLPSIEDIPKLADWTKDPQ